MPFSFRYICSLIENNHLRCLEKILIVVPGLNSLPGILKLHVRIITLQNGDKSVFLLSGAHGANNLELLSQPAQAWQPPVLECRAASGAHHRSDILSEIPSGMKDTLDKSRKGNV